MFLLLRRSCIVYKDFAQYCATEHIESPSPFTDSTTPVPPVKKLLPSPELGPLKMLSPFASIKKMTPLLKSRANAHTTLMKIAAKKEDTKKSPVRKHDEKSPAKKYDDKLMPKVSLHLEEKKSKPMQLLKPRQTPSSKKPKPADIVLSPLTSTEGVRRSSKATLVVCACGNECTEADNGVCKKCVEKFITPTIRGYLYQKADSKTLSRFWFVLMGNRLYRFTAKNEDKANAVFSLVGSFLKEEPPEQIQKKLTVFPIRLFMRGSQLVVYAIKEPEVKQWVKALKGAIGYADLTDHYELGLALGKGKFGLVREATHKQTGEKVAVKIIKKKKLSIEKLALAKREIEIMKVCQHSNIISLLDTFENSDYIYIVLELLRGGDLYEYLEKREFKISEARARNITHSLATALFYLHSYGIVHRDIKLENIMMTEDTDQAEAKLVDFGLSKMIGPSESCKEPFGTIGYAAPEILKNEPYDKAIDIWSLGTVLYIMLTSQMPFDEETEEAIAMYVCGSA
eukprot:TRINITY_DN5659_c0_g1_i11.p1 TRINITY_DN5659_c0_g1~~TRINITY_DN5659_c0_g1_i11.p1  ORF type:complete len:512 (-),score=140.90 TRINITY_DN5659_c0_g1_i11:1507-3042(-)